MFLNKTKDIENLNTFNEAVKLFNSKILVVMKFGSDQLRFTLSEALTTQEDSDLDDFIEAFDDTLDPESPVKILALAKAEAAHKHFHNIDYKKEIVALDYPVYLFPREIPTRNEKNRLRFYADRRQALGDPAVAFLRGVALFGKNDHERSFRVAADGRQVLLQHGGQVVLRGGYQIVSNFGKLIQQGCEFLYAIQQGYYYPFAHLSPFRNLDLRTLLYNID